MNCQRCGATIDPGVHECPFCGLQTPAGAAAAQMAEMARLQNAQMQAQQNAFANEQRRRVAAATIESSATTAMWISLVGTLLCCSPMGIVGGVFGLRARSVAMKSGVAVPMKATIAIVLGLVGAVLTAGFLTFAWVKGSQDEETANARAAALDKKSASKVTAARLDHETACQLGESYLLRNGWDSRSGSQYSNIECPGKLTDSTDSAELEDLTSKYNSETLKVSVCFKRGVKWYVDRLAVGSCAAPPPGAGADASARDARVDSAAASASSAPPSYGRPIF